MTIDPNHYTLFKVKIKSGSLSDRREIVIPVKNWYDAWEIFRSVLVSKGLTSVQITAHYQYEDVAPEHILLRANWLWEKPLKAKEKEECFTWVLTEDKVGYSDMWHLIIRDQF